MRYRFKAAALKAAVLAIGRSARALAALVGLLLIACGPAPRVSQRIERFRCYPEELGDSWCVEGRRPLLRGLKGAH